MSNDTTGVVWDLITPSADKHKLAACLTEEQAKKLWADLAGDAERADRAIRLAAAPARALPLLQGKLAPIAKIDPEQVKKLIAQLESDEFRRLVSMSCQSFMRLAITSWPRLRTTANGSSVCWLNCRLPSGTMCRKR